MSPPRILLERFSAPKKSPRTYITMPKELITFTLLFFFLAGIASYSRGYWLGIQGWGVFNWYVNYDAGFIKRGLIGTILSPLNHSISEYAFKKNIAIAHTTLSLLFGLLLLRLAKETLDQGYRTGALVWSAFISSQFLPTLAYNSGYVDLLLFFLLLLSNMALKGNRLSQFTIIGCTGPLVHEMFVFLWLQIALLVPLIAPTARKTIWLMATAAPFVSTLTVLLCHSQSAAAIVLATVPVDLDMRETLLNQQFGQNALSAFIIMKDKFLSNPANVFAASAYYLSPVAIITITVYCRWRQQQRKFKTNFLALCLASIAPLSILIFAWDLSRILVFCFLTSILTFSMLDDRRTR